MILWFIVGFIVWIVCVLFMLAIIKGGHRVRRHGYEQKLYLRSMDKNQNIEDSKKKKKRRLQEQVEINVRPQTTPHQ